MIIGLFPELATVGGVQLAGRQTAAALARIANQYGWQSVFLSLNDARIEHGMSVAGIDFRFTGFARRKGSFIHAALRHARKKPAVIFAAHPNLAPIARMMKVVSPGAQTIVGAHGIEVWEPLPLVRRIALRKADILIAPSSNTVHCLTSVQGVSEGGIRTVPWPVDPNFVELAEHADKLSLPPDFPPGRIVISVGRWAASERYKGADLLIQAFADLASSFPDVHLVLVGNGDDLPRLKEKSQRSDAQQRIHFLTGISRSELAACYNCAEVFALPSTGEGFGLVFLEAMVFGKPVIGCNAGGIPDVVVHDQEGLLVESTVQSVREALKHLLSDKHLREEMGAKGRQRVNRDFTFECFHVRVLSIVNEFLKKKPKTKIVTP